MCTINEKLEQLAQTCIDYYEHEDFIGNYAHVLAEMYGSDKDVIISRLQEIARTWFDTPINLPEIVAYFIYKWVEDSIYWSWMDSDYLDTYQSAYVGYYSMFSVSFGEQEEQLTGFHGFEDYSQEEIGKAFDSVGYYVTDNNEYAYFDMSYQGLNITFDENDLQNLIARDKEDIKDFFERLNYFSTEEQAEIENWLNSQ